MLLLEETDSVSPYLMFSNSFPESIDSGSLAVSSLAQINRKAKTKNVR